MAILYRDMNKDDVPQVAAVHVEGWQEAYCGMVDADYLAALSVAEKEKSWAAWIDSENTHHIVAEEDGRIIGFISVGPLRTPPPGMSPIRPLYATEIYAVYILSDYYRRGIGRGLFAQAAARIRDMKQKSTCLWVMDKNERANRFYKALGGERCGKQFVEIGPSKVKDVCYGWRDISVFE